MRRYLVLGTLLVLLGIVASACQPGAPAGSTGGNLVATQVAIALTQTAMAAMPASAGSETQPAASIPSSTATALPPTAPPPTATPLPPTAPPPTTTPSPIPTATANAVTPPYEGPCTEALLQPSTGATPDPNEISTFVGYRFAGSLGEHFPIYNSVPRFGAILDSNQLGPGTWGYGFALAGYLREDLGTRQFFFKRMVCRMTNGNPYWEIVDALSLPDEETTGETIFVASLAIWFPSSLADAIHTTAEFAGDGWATLHCPPFPEPQPIAILHIDPANIPPTITKGTTIPVLAAALWVIDPVTQRFKNLPVHPNGMPCSLTFHG